MTDAFSPHMETVAKALLGEPNRALSSKSEMRFGNRGSMSVDLDKGTWYDNEAGEGGGVLALVKRQTGLTNGRAVSYLREDLSIPIEDDRPLQKPATPKRIVATYDYFDEDGDLVFQVCRYEPKDFRQRRPDPTGREEWSWSVKGVRQVPYHLIDILNLEGRGTVYVVEGEKDADKLKAAGFVATCNAGGAGKWPETFREFFGGLDVVIIPDNDDAGRNHCDLVGANLVGVAESVRICDLPELPHKGDVSDWIEAGNDPRLLPTMQTRPWTPAPPKSAFGAIRWADMDAVSIRQDWLVEDLIFQGDAGLMFGASGSGKSFLAVDMGLAIARGEPFLGMKTAKGGVLYQAGEGGKGLLKRLKAYRKHHDVWGKDLPFILLPTPVNLYSSEEDLEAFVQEAMTWKAALSEPLALIVIDTFSTASPGANENTSEDMSRMLAAGQKLQSATGAAILWVHHKNASGERERGHSSLRANVDSAIEVNRDPETNERHFRVVKVKDGEDGAKIAFQLQSVELGASDDGKPITSCVVVPAQAEAPRTGKNGSRTLPADRAFLKVLDDAITQYGGVLPNIHPYPSDTYGVQFKRFRELYVATLGPGKDAQRVEDEIRRIGMKLYAEELIGRFEQEMWITKKGMQVIT